MLLYGEVMVCVGLIALVASARARWRTAEELADRDLELGRRLDIGAYPWHPAFKVQSPPGLQRNCFQQVLVPEKRSDEDGGGFTEDRGYYRYLPCKLKCCCGSKSIETYLKCQNAVAYKESLLSDPPPGPYRYLPRNLTPYTLQKHRYLASKYGAYTQGPAHAVADERTMPESIETVDEDAAEDIDETGDDVDDIEGPGSRRVRRGERIADAIVPGNFFAIIGALTDFQGQGKHKDEAGVWIYQATSALFVADEDMVVGGDANREFERGQEVKAGSSGVTGLPFHVTQRVGAAQAIDGIAYRMYKGEDLHKEAELRVRFIDAHNIVAVLDKETFALAKTSRGRTMTDAYRLTDDTIISLETRCVTTACSPPSRGCQ
jgi:hypothetical protein